MANPAEVHPADPAAANPTAAGQAPADSADALKAAGDIIKLSTGLATGALVFGVGLLPNAPVYTPFVRGCLVASWGLLLVSIVAGVFSQAAIPVLIEDRNYSIEDPYFTYPGRAHQVLFGLGLLALALGLSAVLYAEPHRLRIGTALEATRIVEKRIGTEYVIRQLTKIELIASPSDHRNEATWHAQFEVIPKAEIVKGAGAAPSPRNLDVLVGARSGDLMIVQN